MNRTQLKNEIIEAFEQNFLDGDKMGDHGQCTIAVNEELTNFLLSQLNHALDEQEKAMKIEKENEDIADKQVLAVVVGFNHALAELEALKAEFNK